SNAREQMAYAGFNPVADKNNFIVVAPDGQGTGNGQHFNLGNEPGKQNDVQMTLALLDHLESQLCIDARRVYSTGMSDGGAMTSILACVTSDRFAAFGAVAVIFYMSVFCDRSRPLAITAFSGTADPIVPFKGGTVNCCGGAQ